MDGFVASAIDGNHTYCAANPFSPDCTADTGRLGQPDAMGWHDEREIPNYWAYADRFVLQDHMFESVRSWSLPSHLSMVSGWSATCSTPNDPMSCTTDLGKYPAGLGGIHLRLDADSRGPTSPTCSIGRRELEVLRRGGNAARLRGRFHVLCAAAANGRHPRDLEPAPGVRGRQPGRPGRQRADGEQLLPRRGAGHAAERVVDRPERGRQRAPARVDRHRSGVGDGSGQRGHERARMGEHRDLPGLGRLGRLLRPRRPPDGRRRRLRAARAGARDQPLRQAGHPSITRRCRSTPT